MLKCNQRVTYYKHHRGLCVLPKHGDEVDHLVEMVTPEPPSEKYHNVKKEEQVFDKFVVGFAFDQDKRVAMIKKNRPPWQEGLYNGVGGKIELNETPLQAMIREFDEETGVLVDNWQLYATLRYPKAELYFFKAEVPVEYLDGIESKTDEIVRVFPASSVKPYQMIKNLNWLLPLALYTNATYLPINVVVTDFENEGNPQGLAERRPEN